MLILMTTFGNVANTDKGMCFLIEYHDPMHLEWIDVHCARLPNRRAAWRKPYSVPMTDVDCLPSE